MKNSAERQTLIRSMLLTAYEEAGLWGVENPAWPLPEGLERGSERHLAYLTLVYSIGGGREPVQLWNAARQSWTADSQLFDPRFLAYVKAADIRPRLQAYNLVQKPKTEATVWQRIGQAIVMRGGGEVGNILAGYNFEASLLLEMLAKSKTTFPVLSGPQTGPRWLYGLAAIGIQPIVGAELLPVPVSPAASRAMQALSVEGERVSAGLFEALDLLGRRGCSRRNEEQTLCPVADSCPVAEFCRYGGGKAR